MKGLHNINSNTNLLYVHSCFAIILMGKRELVALLLLLFLFVFLVSGDCCVALPCSTMGLSAVGDCGISRSYEGSFFMFVER